MQCCITSISDKGVSKDKVVKGDLFQGTSKAASTVFELAKKEGLKIEVHSSSPLSLRQYYPKTQLMLCAGHAACSHEKRLKSLQIRISVKKRSRDKYPKVDSAVCHCKKKHAYKRGCGCFSNGFIRHARAKFSLALYTAGTDTEMFACCMRHLGEHHARNEHEWEGGHCDLHSLKCRSCGKCSDNEWGLTTADSTYATMHTCP